MTIDDIIKQEFGVATFPNINPVASALVSGAAQAAKYNSNRVGLLIVNLGTHAMYAMTDNTVSSSKGIVISANGGYLSLGVRDDFHLVAFDWYLSGTATDNFLVIENLIK